MIQVVRTCAHCGIDSEEVLLWLMLLIKGNWMQRRNAGIHLHVAGWEILYTNMGAPWMRERAATREYQVTKTQFEGRGAHLAFAGCRQGCRHWNKALEVNMQKQVGSWEYLNCYGSIWHRATLPTISGSSFKAHLNPTALYTVISQFSSPLESHLSCRHRSFSLYNFCFFSAVPHSRHSWNPQIIANTVSTLMWWLMFCFTFSPPICFIRLANCRSWAFCLLSLWTTRNYCLQALLRSVWEIGFLKIFY